MKAIYYLMGVVLGLNQVFAVLGILVLTDGLNGLISMAFFSILVCPEFNLGMDLALGMIGITVVVWVVYSLDRLS